MKNAIWSVLVIAALGAAATPAYASGRGGGICSIPFIGKYLCPPAPGGGGGSSPVPEPASLVVLATGAGLVGAALRRRRSKK